MTDEVTQPAVAQPAVAQPAVAQPVAEDVVAPPPGHPRFPLIDALRAIAALSVLLFHAGYDTSAVRNPHYGTLIERSNAGVAMFFVISGFLLYRPFVAARVLGAPGTRVRDFARRRVLRIVPGYWLALTVLAIYPGLSGVFSGHWWVYYGFLQAYDVNTLLRGLGQAWTLGVEVSFYVALPLYAALAGRWLRRRTATAQLRRELIVLGLIAAASLALRLYIESDHPFSPLANALPVFADWFAAGMALAVVSVALQSGARRPRFVGALARRPWVAWAVAALAFVAAAELVSGPDITILGGQPWLHFTAGQDLAEHVLFMVVGIAMLVPAVVGTEGGGTVRRVLANRQLAWLGLISYGLYLWQGSVLQVTCQPYGPAFTGSSCRMHGVSLLQHVPLLSLVLIGLAVTVGCAAVSYYVVERPLLRFKYRRRPPRPPRSPSTSASPARPAPAVTAGDR